ncbi:ribbon-helix-helix domain-containing protein [Telluria sp. B2]
MCEFFVSADPILYEARTRSLRIRGMITSIRLENLMWDTLAQIAAEEGRSTNALITTLHDEIMKANGEVSNFASFLRVSCLRYLQRKQQMGNAELPAKREACGGGKTVVSIAGR